MKQTNARRELKALSRKCKTVLKQHGANSRNFRLIYSSVESFENGNGVVIMGLNPAGGPEHARREDHIRPFKKRRYSAYLDDAWEDHPVGKHGLQLAVQGIAMVLTGSTPSKAMKAIQNNTLDPKDRVSVDAKKLLRGAPSGNINPFRSPTYGELSDALQKEGERIGWELLCLAQRLAQPKPLLIVTLASALSNSPWNTILECSGYPPRCKGDDPKKITGRSGNWDTYYYREIVIEKGPLKGALLIGLPAVVRMKVHDDFTEPMLEVLAARRPYYKDRLP